MMGGIREEETREKGVRVRKDGRGDQSGCAVCAAEARQVGKMDVEAPKKKRPRTLDTA
jgi:hypothetical protein